MSFFAPNFLFGLKLLSINLALRGSGSKVVMESQTYLPLTMDTPLQVLNPFTWFERGSGLVDDGINSRCRNYSDLMLGFYSKVNLKWVEEDRFYSYDEIKHL